MQHLRGETLLKCKSEYLMDNTISITDLAIKYKVNPHTLRNYAGNEKWATLREKSIRAQEKAIIAEIERNMPKEIVKTIKTRLLKESQNALGVLVNVINGKGGKGAYNKIIACRDILDRAGFRAPEQLDVKVSKITDIMDKVSVTVSDVPVEALEAGKSVGTVGEGDKIKGSNINENVISTENGVIINKGEMLENTGETLSKGDKGDNNMSNLSADEQGPNTTTDTVT